MMYATITLNGRLRKIVYPIEQDDEYLALEEVLKEESLTISHGDPEHGIFTTLEGFTIEINQE